MARYEIAYWPMHGPPWSRFAEVEAANPKAAVRAVGPQAAGRYRVTPAGLDETAGLFRIHLSSGGCEIVEVEAFTSGLAAREAEADRAADTTAMRIRDRYGAQAPT